MRRTIVLCFVVFTAGLASCAPKAPGSTAADEQRLLELHAAGLKAHMDRDVDALLAHQADDFLLLNRGEISHPSREKQKEFLGPYLAAREREQKPLEFEVAWIELYERRGTEWVSIGNASSFKAD